MGSVWRKASEATSFELSFNRKLSYHEICRSGGSKSLNFLWLYRPDSTSINLCLYWSLAPFDLKLFTTAMTTTSIIQTRQLQKGSRRSLTWSLASDNMAKGIHLTVVPVMFLFLFLWYLWRTRAQGISMLYPLLINIYFSFALLYRTWITVRHWVRESQKTFFLSSLLLIIWRLVSSDPLKDKRHVVISPFASLYLRNLFPSTFNSRYTKKQLPKDQFID